MSAVLIELHAEPPGQGIVELLETALERARAGELSSLAISLVYRDGQTGHMWSFAPSIGLLIGATARTLHKLNLEKDEG